MKKENIKSLIIILVFVLFIGVVSIVTLITAPQTNYLENEKRNTAKMPMFSVNTLLDTTYLKGSEKYLEDRIFGRSFFVGANSYMKLLEGGNILEDVYMCREGYLINAPKPLNEKNIINNLSRFEDFSKEVKLPSRMIIVPSPGYVMSEIVPDKNALYCDDYIFSKAEEILSNTQLTDVRDSLKSAFESGNTVYYKTDHHLTSYGCYILYSEFMKEAGLNPLGKGKFNIETHKNFCGTTRASSGYFLTKGEDIELWHSGFDLEVSISNGKEYEKTHDSFFFREHLENDDKYPVFADGNHALTKIRNKSKSGKNLLIIKDSYAHCTANFLSCEYENIYMIDLRYYRFPVSEFVKENDIDELLFLYGTDAINTDTNSAWLY